jgi:hypothetical protein
MYVEKTLFAHVMELCPGQARRIVARYRTWMQDVFTRPIAIAPRVVVCDQTLALNGFYTAKDYPKQLRRIGLKDPDSGRR